MNFDHEAFFDLVWNEIQEEMETVLSVGWDGGYMSGSSGAVWFQRWRGIYVMTSSDMDPEGPFESLDEVLNHEFICRPIANADIDSTCIPQAQLLELARQMVQDEGDTVEVNGQMFVLAEGALRPSE